MMNRALRQIQSYFRSWRIRGLALALVMAVLLVGGLRCQHHTPKDEALAPILYEGSRLVVPQTSALRSVITMETLIPQKVVTFFSLPAVIQSIRSKTVQILPPLTGQIDDLPKKIGDRVRAGDPLMVMVSPDLAQALADRSKAQAVYTLTEQTLKRQRSLLQIKVSSMHEMQQAEQDFEQAKAELARTLARLSALHIPESDHQTQGEIIVHSPVDGVVTSVNAGIGTYWSDLTSPVMEVADLSQVIVMASAQEKDLADIFLGQSVEVILDSDASTYVSKVHFLNPLLDPDTRTVSVGLYLDNPKQRLKPNMFVKAVFQRQAKTCLTLPVTAIIQRGFDSIVFVEVAPWVFEPRVVFVGDRLDDTIEIKSGLVAGERVVLTGGIILND